MPIKTTRDGSWKMGRCPIHGIVPFRGQPRCPKTGCKFSLAESWQMTRDVPRELLFQRFREYMRGLSANERKLVRKHFEEGGEYPDTEDGRAFVEVLRKEDW